MSQETGEDLETSSEPSAPAWMATFGDLMSLLLTFFVLLMSFASMDVRRFAAVVGSMRDAFGVQTRHAGPVESLSTSLIELSETGIEITPRGRLLLRNIALLVFGSEDRAVHQGLLVNKSFDIGLGIIIPATKLAGAGLSVVAFVAVWLLMHKTRMGKALTATALNPQGARYMGISTEKMNALAWGIGGGTVTMAGALIVNFWPVNPYVGLLFTMIAFTIVALGGFGSVPGAFFAALVVGLITEIPGFWDFLTYTLEMDWMFDVPMTSFKYMWIYVAYFIIMVVRPRGLFGWKH